MLGSEYFVHSENILFVSVTCVESSFHSTLVACHVFTELACIKNIVYEYLQSFRNRDRAIR